MDGFTHANSKYLTRGRLFKVNDVVSYRFVKYYKYTVFLLENAKDSHIFPTKNNSVFDNIVGIYLTS